MADMQINQRRSMEYRKPEIILTRKFFLVVVTARWLGLDKRSANAEDELESMKSLNWEKLARRIPRLPRWFTL